MDLQSQLENLFPDHKYSEVESEVSKEIPEFSFSQNNPLFCKYEKRKGKAITIVEGFDKINKDQIKLIARNIKQKFSVGGSVKNNSLLIQGDIRDHIMKYLSSIGFKVKRVGG